MKNTDTMNTRGTAIERKIISCTTERRRKIYRAAAQRLQRFADSHPEVRFDADTHAITLATDNLNDALASFIGGACGPEVVGQAFDGYERALIEASQASCTFSGSDHGIARIVRVNRTLRVVSRTGRSCRGAGEQSPGDMYA
jgi:hypothetical protein